MMAAAAEAAYLEAKVTSMEGKDATYFAALEAEKKKKAAEAVYLEVKVASMESTKGKPWENAQVTKAQQPKNTGQSFLATLAAYVGAARVQREYEDTSKVVKDDKPWWQTAWDGLLATAATFTSVPTSATSLTRTPPLSTTPTPTITPQIIPTPSMNATPMPYEFAKKQDSWWQRSNVWLAGRVEAVVKHPPAWLSFSYSPGDFSLANYTVSHGITYQPSARDFLQSFTYQRVDLNLKTQDTFTVNPKGWLDLDFSDGTITFSGNNNSLYIQPAALNMGWSTSSNLRTITSNGMTFEESVVNKTTVDIDLFGENMFSFKVSNAVGNKISQTVNVDGTDIQRVQATDLDVSLKVHRWPRIIAAAAAVYLVFEVGATVIAPSVVPWIIEKLPLLTPLLGTP